jgi:hypothetical protein
MAEEEDPFFYGDAHGHLFCELRYPSAHSAFNSFSFESALMRIGELMDDSEA